MSTNLGQYATPGATPWNRGLRVPTDILSASEIAKLLNQCSKRSGSGLRNRALIICLWRGGLRVAEAVALTVSDVDLDRMTLHVRHGKGNKRRFVSIDPAAVAVLRTYIKARSLFPTVAASPYMFCTRRGKPISTGYARNLLKRLSLQAGLDEGDGTTPTKRIHPHALRHSFAVELLYEGLPLNMIQAQLGHSNLAVTSNYLAHVSSKDLNAAMARRTVPAAVATVL